MKGLIIALVLLAGNIYAHTNPPWETWKLTADTNGRNFGATTSMDNTGPVPFTTRAGKGAIGPFANTGLFINFNAYTLAAITTSTEIIVAYELYMDSNTAGTIFYPTVVGKETAHSWQTSAGGFIQQYQYPGTPALLNSAAQAITTWHKVAYEIHGAAVGSVLNVDGSTGTHSVYTATYANWIWGKTGPYSTAPLTGGVISNIQLWVDDEYTGSYPYVYPTNTPSPTLTPTITPAATRKPKRDNTLKLGVLLRLFFPLSELPARSVSQQNEAARFKAALDNTKAVVAIKMEIIRKETTAIATDKISKYTPTKTQTPNKDIKTSPTVTPTSTPSVTPTRTTKP